MGIRGNREVTLVISDSFEVSELVNELVDLCDGRPEDYVGSLSGLYSATDQRDSDTATLKFKRKEGVISRPRTNKFQSPDEIEDVEPEPMSFDQDPFGENPSGIPR